jgi:hypothetical protein
LGGIVLTSSCRAPTISLCYDKDTKWWNGNEHWIEIDAVAAANGNGSYNWDSSGVAPGTYYIAGYLWSGGKAYLSHLTQSITIQGGSAPEPTLTGLTSAASGAGINVSIQATASNVAAEQISSSRLSCGTADTLSQNALAPIVAEAIARWEATGLSSQDVSRLAALKVQIVDLPGSLLGVALPDRIQIDRDAVGCRWFVDPTPQDDAEFARLAATSLAARPNTAADAHADLLTVVMHEMGHELGYADDVAGDLMDTLLPLGVRRTLVVD